MNSKKIIAIVGPTATGKTALSIDLAEHFHGEVISADSRQVYRGLDIGTEKITPEEMREVPHHLLDVVEPEVVFTAADFKKLGEQAITEIQGRGNIPFVVGGTGFYISALLDNLIIPEVPPNPTLRGELEKLSTDALYTSLKTKDPERASEIDPKNRRRVIRALEIAATLGVVPSLPIPETRYDTLYIGLDAPDEVLKERIDKRLKQELERGLLKEVEKLCAQLPEGRLNEFGYEYRLSALYLERKITEVELKEQLNNELWHYAKRQRTWFRRDKRIQWFTFEENNKIEEIVREFLKAT